MRKRHWLRFALFFVCFEIEFSLKTMNRNRLTRGKETWARGFKVVV